MGIFVLLYMRRLQAFAVRTLRILKEACPCLGACFQSAQGRLQGLVPKSFGRRVLIMFYRCSCNVSTSVSSICVNTRVQRRRFSLEDKIMVNCALIMKLACPRYDVWLFHGVNEWKMTNALGVRSVTAP